MDGVFSDAGFYSNAESACGPCLLESLSFGLKVLNYVALWQCSCIFKAGDPGAGWSLELCRGRLIDQEGEDRATARGRRSILLWVLLSLLGVLAALLVVADAQLHHAQPILKARVIQTLSQRFRGRVELDELQVSIFRGFTHGLEVSGHGLRIFPPPDVVAAGATHPLISVRAFDFHAGLMGLFVTPMHVEQVHVRGLVVTIPPRETRVPLAAAGDTKSSGMSGKPQKMKIEVSEFLCDDSQLVIDTNKPNKDPKRFILQSSVLHDVGPDRPLTFDATVINAIPKGQIHTTGSFGPWNVESPGDAVIDGRYTFDHVDLNTIRGIGGMLSSTGSFQGRLNQIEARGKADVPNFSLDTANHPVPLHTQFTVIVDALTGDTYLRPVHAVLGASAFQCAGEIVNVKGKGHIVDLTVDVPAGRIQDFLALVVKTEPVVMTGVMQTHARLHIPPGKVSISQKMRLEAQFHLQQIHFVRPAVQQKVNLLSERASGNPEAARPGAPEVTGQMAGDLKMSNAAMSFSGLHYAIPGAAVEMQGVYSLDGRKFDFTGEVKTEARLSEMVSTWWKSLLLKPVDKYFAKNGAGVDIPFKMTGIDGEPKFGLDFGRKPTSTPPARH